MKILKLFKKKIDEGKYNPKTYEPFEISKEYAVNGKYFYHIYINIITKDGYVDQYELNQIEYPFLSDNDELDKLLLLASLNDEWVKLSLYNDESYHYIIYEDNKFRTYLPKDYNEIFKSKFTIRDNAYDRLYEYYWITYLDEGRQMLDEGMPTDWITKALGYTEDADARILFEMKGDI